MLILALDTTTRHGSLALWRDGLVEERIGNASLSHAERLPGDLAALLDAHGARLADVERYAVASGPGSFTGMRVGIATIQGLALVHGRLVVPVSALECLATQVATVRRLERGHLVGGWMEAYRGEVFAALYRVIGQAGDRRLATLALVDAPRVARAPALAAAWGALVGTNETLAIGGDAAGVSRPLLTSTFGDGTTLDDPPALAGTLAAIAARDADRTVRPHAIVPLYVRRPDAEIARGLPSAGSPVVSQRAGPPGVVTPSPPQP